MTMKLTYFNVRGLAETSRILLAIGGEEYEDYRYPLVVTDMAKHEMTKDEFDRDKADNKLLSSLNKVPFLEVDGATIPQSKSIERFLGRRFGMMGQTDIEGARIDSLCECVRDLKDLYQKVRTSDNLDEAMSEWFTVTLVERLRLLDGLLDDSGYSVGSITSLSDVVLFSFVTEFFDNKAAALNATLVAPRLRSVVDRIACHESVVSWLSRRPQTDF
jgi:glutathione S-transferase